MGSGGPGKPGRVIDNGIVKEYVGIGWIDVGLAVASDYLMYPELEDDLIRPGEKSFYVNLGDSYTGPIGLRARIIAKSKREVVAALKKSLPTHVPVFRQGDEFIEIYLNISQISVKDVDEVGP